MDFLKGVFNVLKNAYRKVAGAANSAIKGIASLFEGTVRGFALGGPGKYVVHINRPATVAFGSAMLGIYSVADTLVKGNIRIAKNPIMRGEGKDSIIESTFEIKRASLDKTPKDSLSAVFEHVVDRSLSHEGHWIPESPVEPHNHANTNGIVNGNQSA